ncbi:trypsin-like peptidase domain-containing protein [Streptomyces sp. AC627_RSS907]|uniref:trypsin-like peptidase domain-containing protein n=1 Tax=Streptomyces sp. AC627_RSS907 TaxID=2823684 RepID=UPI001C25087A|nr:trypsin-like peptidase domain-containing protein [Streptomyces sp. AC627_RSS907]
MNEGKPTKAKWWSRPRSSGDATDGDFELERPRTTPTTGTGGDGSDGGDFELERPSPPRPTAEGDYELDRPAPTGGSDDAAPSAGAGTGADGGTVTVAERPKPLHDPDPYSTPPYGEPGPWAPAPPVQHPSASALTPPPGAAPDPSLADAPPPVPPAHGTGASALPPPPGGPTGPASSPLSGAAAPDPAAGAGTTPAHGTPAAATPPVSAPPAEPSAFPVPDPWRRYDPWAASAAAAPLQHSGAVTRTPEQRRRRAVGALVAGCLLIALVSGGIGGAIGAYLERNGGVGTVELPQARKEPAERSPDSVAGIAARALPGVVTLHASGGEAAGTGTGFVLDGNGHILTNNHVVEPAGSGGEITVTFNSGDTAEATVVGRDSGYDLAVVKVRGVRGLTPMPLGNSENVHVGDPVVAIGAPFDLAGTVTSGIISAKERPITAGGEEGDGSDVSYVDALQTDAPINPGNSGGPLLDSQGRVIGINSAIRSAGGGAEPDGGQAGSIGLGFAIPINQGKRVAEELINTGKATHPVIGITLDMNYTGDGARVGTKGGDGGPPVTAGGPGAAAGLRAGDVITEVDGRRVHSGEELIVKTRAHRPGDRLELTLERDGKETKVSLVLGSSDGD